MGWQCPPTPPSPPRPALSGAAGNRCRRPARFKSARSGARASSEWKIGGLLANPGYVGVSQDGYWLVRRSRQLVGTVCSDYVACSRPRARAREHRRTRVRQGRAVLRTTAGFGGNGPVSPQRFVGASRASTRFPAAAEVSSEKPACRCAKGRSGGAWRGYCDLVRAVESVYTPARTCTAGL